MNIDPSSPSAPQSSSAEARFGEEDFFLPDDAREPASPPEAGERFLADPTLPADFGVFILAGVARAHTEARHDVCRDDRLGARSLGRGVANVILDDQV